MRASSRAGGRHFPGLYYKGKKWFMKILLICFIMIATLVCSIVGRDQHTEIVMDRSPAENVQASDETGEDAAETGAVPLTEGYVDISGAVHHPGVYQVTSETRLYEIIEKAGGLKETADIDQINQASFVEDGMKIIIPEIGQTVPGEAGAESAQSSGKININSADKAALMTLPGIGEAYAERIIDYRSANPFRRIEDLKNVSGIGDATFDKLKDHITV